MLLRALRLLVLAAFALFFAGPLLWLVLATTKDGHGSLHSVVLAWRQLDSFNEHMFRRWMLNSCVYTLAATALTIATAVPAGYGLALGRFAGRRVVLAITIITMVMPPATLVLPIFLELNAVHLIGSSLSVILPFAFFPFGVFVAYLYYASLPAGLLDAARVDGCSEWQTFYKVALPLAKPVIALVFFFAFVADWTNFFLPYVLLMDSAQFPVQVGLTDIFQGSESEVALASLIAAAPVALVFVLSQRSIVRGTWRGAIVE